VPDEALRARDLQAVEAALRKEFGERTGEATRDYRALRTLLDHPSQHVWVTFEEGFLWWATARDEIEINPEGETSERGHFWIPLDVPWSNRSLVGRSLAVADLPGVVAAVAGFRATLCRPKASCEILRIIRDEEDEDAAAARIARAHYSSAIARLVSRLAPRDFELLVDLILSRSGWTRVAQLGGVTEGIDIEVENAALDELAFVQVKSRADNVVLGDYVSRFADRRDRYARMIFAVHTTKGALSAPHDIPVQVWDQARVSELLSASGSRIGLRSGSRTGRPDVRLGFAAARPRRAAKLKNA
jgi:hypothetical protein